MGLLNTKLLHFPHRSSPQEDDAKTATAANQSAPPPAAAPRSPREIFGPMLKAEVENYVFESIAQSLSETEESKLVALGYALIEEGHKPFIKEDRDRLDADILRLRKERDELAATFKIASDRATGLEQKIGPKPAVETAAEIAVIATVLMFAFSIATGVEPVFELIAEDAAGPCAALFGLVAGVLIVKSVLGLQGRAK